MPSLIEPANYPLVGALAIGALALAFLWAPDDVTRTLVYSLRIPLVVVAIVLGVSVHGARPSRAWVVISAGLMCLFLDELMSPSTAGATSPTSTTLLSIVAHALLVAGSAWLLRHLLRGSSYLGLLDTAVIMVAVFLALWLLVFGPVITARSEGDGSGAGLALPLLSGIGFSVMVSLTLSPSRKTPFSAYMIAAIAALSLGNVARLVAEAQAVWMAHPLADTLAWLGTGLAAVAVLHPSVGLPIRSRSGRSRRLSRGRLTLLMAATLTAPVLLLVLAWRGAATEDIAVLAVAGSIMSALLILRLAGANRLLLASTKARLRAERALGAVRTRDGLTGAFNREGFARQVDGVLGRGAGPFAVLICDLDDFKHINDMEGHEAGDAALVRAARRLRELVRPGDIVGRLGSDEFAILLPGADRGTAVDLARRLVDGLHVPQGPRSGPPIRASVGVALAAAGSGDALDILRSADIAMYVAKTEGKARAVVFGDSMRADLVRRLQIVAGLEQAIAASELTLAYQPIVDLRSEDLHGLEALVRWRHPVLGAMRPDDFIPLAEGNGLIVPLGRYVLDAACRQAAVWASARVGPGLPVSVNVSTRELAEDDFVDAVRFALQGSALDPGLLCLEVTETALADLPVVEPKLAALRDLGVRISIDDFGTGYSSLAYLSRLPIDALKVDRSFVRSLGRAEVDSAVTGAVIALARRLDVATVAEGIESRSQVDLLRALGCTYGQGFLFGAPMPAAAVARLIAQQEARDTVGVGVVRRGEGRGTGRRPVRALGPGPLEGSATQVMPGIGRVSLPSR